ncbi:MAG TPA: helix-turn-helix transcriptional regulator [Steroidobacteraceae bacterium]|nr:helix-turn-helix transcriptional regulator [Steroidobacteraceae bacterium]
MPIIVRLDVMLATRKMRSNELASAIGITDANLSLLKSGKVKGLRFSTLAAICAHLNCQPGDLLEYVPDVRQTGSSRKEKGVSA